MKTKKQTFKIGQEVKTPEGVGEIIAESPVGEFMIKLTKGGLVYYYEDDLVSLEDAHF